MLNYVRQFTLYTRNEDGDPQFFFAFLAQVTHYLTAVKIKKQVYRVENFRANVLKRLWRPFYRKVRKLVKFYFEFP